jgi:HK97 gp10 family phage protein
MASIGRNLEIMQAVRLINRKLGAVAAAVEDEVVGTMLTQAGLIAAEIKSIAPVDETSDNPGELKASVRVIEGKRTAKKAFSVKVAVGNLQTKDGKAGFNYPRGVEFGTQKSPAHPFFWPIWRLRRKGARVAIRKSAVQAVKRVFGDK